MTLNKRFRLKYQHKIFLLFLVLSWLLTACFLAFLYDREKQYKAERLDEQLQLFNMHMSDALENGVSLADFVAQTQLPLSQLRVTVVDSAGNVVYDNSTHSLPETNHLDRPEIRQSLAEGTGYSLQRRSATTDETYFYSAMRSGRFIVRSAAPYDVSLSELLAADSTFLWFMLGVTLIISLVGWVATRRIGRTITRLNDFARKAEAGEQIYADQAFSHDELGEISSHIVSLYAAQQKHYAMTLQLEQDKTRIKRQLTNNINHELKTPLAAILVCLETLTEHPELDDDQKSAIIAQCYANGRRLQSLLDDVSTLTRLDEGKAVIEKSAIDVNEVIAEVVAEYTGHGYLPIKMDFAAHIGMSGNRALWDSVFRNLIINANAYSGGTQITIEIPDNRHICFYDDGAGVPDEHLERIFERFYRIDKGRSREQGGTGLGLAIVKNALLFHGARISAANRRPHGLHFTISL